MVRRGFVCVFQNDEGKVFHPTARHIWDALPTATLQVQSTLSHDESSNIFDQMIHAAEIAGQELYASLKQVHLDSVIREEERGMVAFAARRRAIERLGLPEVRQYRLTRCDAEELQWRRELQTIQQIVPEIRPLLALRVRSAQCEVRS